MTFSLDLKKKKENNKNTKKKKTKTIKERLRKQSAQDSSLKRRLV